MITPTEQSRAVNSWVEREVLALIREDRPVSEAALIYHLREAGRDVKSHGWWVLKAWCVVATPVQNKIVADTVNRLVRRGAVRVTATTMSSGRDLVRGTALDELAAVLD